MVMVRPGTALAALSLTMLCLMRGVSAASPVSYVKLVWASERLLEHDEDCHEIRDGAWYDAALAKLFPKLFEKMSNQRSVDYGICIDKLRVEVKEAEEKKFIFQESPCYIGSASFRVFHFVYYVKRMLPCDQ